MMASYKKVYVEDKRRGAKGAFKSSCELRKRWKSEPFLLMIPGPSTNVKRPASRSICQHGFKHF